ncbi:MAG: hypothetical protein Q8R10_16930 [Pseudomonas sp.]|uniref:hypothetical protein n=1 Tax=Pseudomonas sp. TaxID=306 RepID=UPI0027374AAD|nr:hypothetical protein [Pseudomonas sp.]MDP3848101.1 hypothetical protein [Pseudomonas sp.]
MDISQSLTALKSAMADIDSKLDGLNEELSGVEHQVSDLRKAKADLYAAPLRLSDHSQYLKEAIQQHGKGVASVWARERFGWSACYGTPYAEKPWESFEGVDGVFKDIGQMVSAAGEATNTFKMLCFFTPDAVHEKLMARLHEVVGENMWGNLEHPTIAERRKLIAEIDAKVEDLGERRGELKTEIQEITSAFSR